MSEFNLKDSVETKEEAEFKQDVDKWKTRRRMAYFSLYSASGVLLFLAILLIFFPNVLKFYSNIESTVITIVLGWFSLVALYFGATTLAETFGGKIK